MACTVLDGLKLELGAAHYGVRRARFLRLRARAHVLWHELWRWTQAQRRWTALDSIPANLERIWLTNLITIWFFENLNHRNIESRRVSLKSSRDRETIHTVHIHHHHPICEFIFSKLHFRSNYPSRIPAQPPNARQNDCIKLRLTGVYCRSSNIDWSLLSIHDSSE